MAGLINISQFYIVTGAGAVSSTVVGHVKTCSIVTLGWATSGRKANDQSALGLLLAISGIFA
jgi:solute carrier family 35 protein E3